MSRTCPKCGAESAAKRQCPKCLTVFDAYEAQQLAAARAATSTTERAQMAQRFSIEPKAARPRRSALPWLVGAISIAGIYSALIMEPRAPDAPRAEIDTPVSRPTVSVSAQELLEDFHANEVRATDKYKGSQIRISGVVENISTQTFSDDPSVRLDCGKMFENVVLNVNASSRAGAAALSKGSAVTAYCTRVSMTLRSVFADGCEL